MLWLCLWSVFIRGHEVSEENAVVIYVLVCVIFSSGTAASSDEAPDG